MLRKVLEIRQIDVVPRKKNLIKTFRDFRVFEYASWQKTKTRKRRKSRLGFLNQKTHIVNKNQYQKAAKTISVVGLH